MSKYKTKWAWLLAILNAIYACFFFFVLASIMLAMSAMAEIEGGWIFLFLVVIGFALVISATYLGIKSKPKWFFLAYLSNGLSALIYGIPMLFWIYILATSQNQKIIIYDKYMGNVTIVEGVVGGERIKYEGRTQVIRIPSTGILLLADSLPRGVTSRKYFYENQKRELKPIDSIWHSTIHPTPENLGDSLSVGIYNETSGSFSGPEMKCMFTNESFYVGTKPWILNNYEERDMSSYLDSVGVTCPK